MYIFIDLTLLLQLIQVESQKPNVFEQIVQGRWEGHRSRVGVILTFRLCRFSSYHRVDDRAPCVCK